MHYVLLATHNPDTCPTSSAKTRALMAEIGPQMPKIAEKSSVKILAGPYVNREHISVVVVEADKAEDLDTFIAESRLAQWNSVRVLPSMTMQEAMADIESQPAIF